jgi:hypothetical protein
MANEFQNATGFNANVAIRATPLHIVELNNGKSQRSFFIAIKIDEAHHGVKVTGFHSVVRGTAEAMNEKTRAVIGTSPETIVEATFPWHRIESIENLGYKHKGISK